MKETQFIQQNKEKWQKIEEELEKEEKDPDKLCDILIQVTDDLSYSRTFYPNRSVKVYLNNIAQKIQRNIYKNKNENRKKLISFWKEDLPLLVYNCRAQLLISFIVFTVSAMIGVLSSKYDKEFPTLILGSDYIQLTLENIKKGDPMGIYKSSDQVDMFLRITFNNVFVAFRTFIFGVVLAIGSVMVLIYNGIMVGTFQYFFVERGLFLDSFLTIWLHGTLEISAIIIAGGAGLVLGRGLVFPGTYSRTQAFQISAKLGLKLFLAVVPILVFAGFIEGFLTRYTEVHWSVKALLIVVSLAFITGYFIYYPYLKSKNSSNVGFQPARLHERKKHIIEVDTIKNNNEIFKDLFSIYSGRFSFILIAGLMFSLIYTAVINIFFKKNILDGAFLTGALYKITMYFNYSEHLGLYYLNTLFVSLLIVFVIAIFQKQVFSNRIILKKYFIYFLKSSFVLAVLNVAFFLPFGLGIILVLILLPIMLLTLFSSIVEDKSLIKAFGTVLTYVGGHFGQIAGMFFILGFISMIFLFLLGSPLLIVLIYALELFIQVGDEFYGAMITNIFLFVSVLGVTMIWPVLIFGHALLYYSLKEICEANSLRSMIERLKVDPTN